MIAGLLRVGIHCQCISIASSAQPLPALVTNTLFFNSQLQLALKRASRSGGALAHTWVLQVEAARIACDVGSEPTAIQPLKTVFVIVLLTPCVLQGQVHKASSVNNLFTVLFRVCRGEKIVTF